MRSWAANFVWREIPVCPREIPIYRREIPIWQVGGKNVILAPTAKTAKTVKVAFFLSRLFFFFFFKKIIKEATPA
jgi:hypothetical protein